MYFICYLPQQDDSNRQYQKQRDDRQEDDPPGNSDQRSEPSLEEHGQFNLRTESVVTSGVSVDCRIFRAPVCKVCNFPETLNTDMNLKI